MAQARNRMGWLDAATAGLVQGATFNFGDEIARAMGDQSYTDYMRQAQEERPGFFAAGNVAGNVIPWGSAARVAIKGAGAGLPFLQRAMMIDAATGGAYAAGGQKAGEIDLQDRLEAGARGAGIGALTAGLVPLAFRAGDQVRNNLPVLAGKPALNAEQKLFFAGGRNAEDLVGEALSRDEAVARGEGATTLFGRYGTDGTAMDAAGPNTRALFDVAEKGERGGKIAKQNADMMARDAIETRLRRLRGPDGAPIAPVSSRTRAAVKGKVTDREFAGNGIDTFQGRDVQDLLAALDDPAAHKEWVRYARERFADEPPIRSAVAERIVARIRERSARAKGAELQSLLERLQPKGDLGQKLKALGVERLKERAVRGVPANARREFTSADDRLAVREPAQRTPQGRTEPEDMARVGLSEEDAAALMTALHQPRRINYLPASAGGDPLLELKAMPGMKWGNPFAVDPALSKVAYYTGKPTAVIADQEMHGGGLSLLPDDIRRLQDEQNGKRRTARNRWTPHFAA